MKNKKSTLLTIVILILICVILGVSYAYWQITRTQVDKNIVTTGCFEIESDIGTQDELDPIRLLKTYPISDSEGKELTPFTFTIRNTCDTYAGYQINLETLNTTTLNKDYLKASLDNKDIKVLSSYDSVETTVTGATSSNKLLTGGLKAGKSKTFNLRLWIDSNTPLSEGQNKTYEGKVSIIMVPGVDPTPVKECTAYEQIKTVNYDNCMTYLSDNGLDTQLINIGFTQSDLEQICHGEDTTTTIPISDPNNPEPLNLDTIAPIFGDSTETLVQKGVITVTTTDNIATLTQGLDYGDGTYTYRYKQGYHDFWTNITEDGWGVILTDKSATEVNTQPCTSINGKPIVDMSGMFSGANHLERIDVSSFDTSNVVSMYRMFNTTTDNNGFPFEIIGLDNWDVSSVTDMSYMFWSAGEEATTWNIGDLSDWDVSSVQNMDYMFQRAAYFTNTLSIEGLSNWDVSKVESMSHMFDETGFSATTWNIGDLSNWDVSSVENMSLMFYQAGRNATTWSIGDLSSWDTSKVTNMQGMFYDTGSYATTWNSIGTLKTYASDISSIFEGNLKAKATLEIYSNPTSYSRAFNYSAIEPGSLITVNYSSATTNIDNIIATKSTESNVVKGVQLD